MTNWTLREAVYEDAAKIMDLKHELATEPNLPVYLQLSETVAEECQHMHPYLESPNSNIMLAQTLDGRLIGMAYVAGGSLDVTRHMADIHRVAIHRDFRGMGLGEALMCAVIDWAQANAMLKRLELELFVGNKRALNLYRKLGFVVQGRRNRSYFINDEYIDVYMMMRFVSEEFKDPTKTDVMKIVESIRHTV